jgi:hypothetical protein
VKHFIIISIFLCVSTFAKSSLPLGHCQDPFNIYIKLNKSPEQVANDLINARVNNSSPVILDIGGEGRFEGAINLNPQFLTSTTGTEGRLIPHWLPGTGNDIPIPSFSVDFIHLQNAPINIDTMKEILRVMKPRSKIHLTHPTEYAETYVKDMKILFEGYNIKRVDEGIMSDFYITP